MGVSITITQRPDIHGGATISAETELYQTDKTAGIFCIRPVLTLVYWSSFNEIRLTVRDHDDMDYSRMYLIDNTSEARRVFHELLNFLYDIADSIVDSDKMFNDVVSGEFYPEIPNIKTCWEWEMK